MKRRFFLQRLGVAVAGCLAAPALLASVKKTQGPVPPFKIINTPVHGEVCKVAVINPEWVDAPYEFIILADPRMLKAAQDGLLGPPLPGSGLRRIRDPWPVRFRTEEDALAYQDSLFKRAGTNTVESPLRMKLSSATKK